MDEWWVTTGPLEDGGEMLAGPFRYQDTAIEKRSQIEADQNRGDLWILPVATAQVRGLPAKSSYL